MRNHFKVYVAVHLVMWPALCCCALQILWEQAQRGEQPGLMLMQDALSGEKKAQTWGNEPTNKEPDEQN